MRKKNDAPSRGEITEKVTSQETNMSDKVEELEIIATDTETVRDTLDSLEFEGTSEGSDEVQSSIEHAEDVTVEIFDREDGNLEEIQNETEEYEGELQEREDSSESDLSQISDAAGKIETQETVSELDSAREAISSDIEFLNEQNETAREAREECERQQQEQRGRVQNGKR